MYIHSFMHELSTFIFVFILCDALKVQAPLTNVRTIHQSINYSLFVLYCLLKNQKTKILKGKKKIG